MRPEPGSGLNAQNQSGVGTDEEGDELMLRQDWRSVDERSQVKLMFEALKGWLGRYLGTMVKCVSVIVFLLASCFKAFPDDFASHSKLTAAKLPSGLEDIHTFLICSRTSG
jgi:hypothetical protein